MKSNYSSETYNFIEKFEKYFNNKTNLNFNFKFIDLDNKDYLYAIEKITNKEYEFYYEDLINDLDTKIILIYFNNFYIGCFTIYIQEIDKNIEMIFKNCKLHIIMVAIIVEKKYRNKKIATNIIKYMFEFSLENKNMFGITQPKPSLCHLIFDIYTYLRTNYTDYQIAPLQVNSKHFDDFLYTYNTINDKEKYEEFVNYKRCSKSKDTAISLVMFAIGYKNCTIKNDMICVENCINEVKNFLIRK